MADVVGIDLANKISAPRRDRNEENASLSPAKAIVAKANGIVSAREKADLKAIMTKYAATPALADSLGDGRRAAREQKHLDQLES